MGSWEKLLLVVMRIVSWWPKLIDSSSRCMQRQGPHMASKSLGRNLKALSAKINSQHDALFLLLLV